MRAIPVLLVILLSFMPASAGCLCQCVDGEMQPLCDNTTDLPPICPRAVCFPPPPSLAPLNPATLPPLGGAVEQTASTFAALVAANAPLDAAAIASGFRQGKRVEKKINAVLMSLARLGHVTATNGGQKFEIRRAA